MHRNRLSGTMQAALTRKIITQDTTIFDYGCGRGGDVELLAAQGFAIAGYDPYYFPNHPIIPADVVVLSYVLNTIENAAEREQVLLRAYELAKTNLVVGVIIQPQHHLPGRGATPYNDGFLTRWQTFEKHWLATEFRVWVEAIFGISPRRLAQGVYSIPKQPTLLLPLHQSPELRRQGLQTIQAELVELEKGWILPPDAYLERHVRKGHTYWRIKSKSRSLPGNKKLLYLGRAESDVYARAMVALQRRDAIALLRRRIAALS
jgi:DNA phosphorothioation-associated putative methyltransferase